MSNNQSPALLPISTDQHICSPAEDLTTVAPIVENNGETLDCDLLTEILNGAEVSKRCQLDLKNEGMISLTAIIPVSEQEIEEIIATIGSKWNFGEKKTTKVFFQELLSPQSRNRNLILARRASISAQQYSLLTKGVAANAKGATTKGKRGGTMSDKIEEVKKEKSYPSVDVVATRMLKSVTRSIPQNAPKFRVASVDGKSGSATVICETCDPSCAIKCLFTNGYHNFEKLKTHHKGGHITQAPLKDQENIAQIFGSYNAKPSPNETPQENTLFLGIFPKDTSQSHQLKEKQRMIEIVSDISAVKSDLKMNDVPTNPKEAAAIATAIANSLVHRRHCDNECLKYNFEGASSPPFPIVSSTISTLPPSPEVKIIEESLCPHAEELMEPILKRKCHDELPVLRDEDSTTKKQKTLENF